MSKLARSCFSNFRFCAVLRKIQVAHYNKGINVETQDLDKYNIKPIKPIESAYTRFKPSNLRSSIPIIILHCILGSRKQWENLGRDLAERTARMVYTLDARNHGASDHAVSSDYWALTLDLEYFMAIHGIPRCQILGHSLGGRTGMFLALNKPEMVEKLLVQDISPISLPKNIVPALVFVSNALKELMKSLPEGLSLPEAQMFAHKMLEPAAPFPTFRQLLVDSLEEREGQIICNLNLDYLSSAKSLNTDLDLFPTEGQYHGPVQFVCAEKPVYVRNEDYDGIRKMFPNVKIVRVEAADHLMHMDIPSHYLNIVADFFDASKE